MPVGGDVIIGIDAGTSVIKSVAFATSGRQIAAASVPNRYGTRPDGAAAQSMEDTWKRCVRTLRDLVNKVENLAGRAAAIAVTGQGDGTWLVDPDGKPVSEAWLWLDSRAAPTVRRLLASDADRERYRVTGTGLNACQMGAQLAHMKDTAPELIAAADLALHCKDWLYFELTRQRATSPCEATFTFGDFRARKYDDRVIEALGLTSERHLLPEIIDGTEIVHGLAPSAARETGLKSGTPVSLGYLDVSCAALGAGIHIPGESAAGCTILGSTGMHMRAALPDQAVLNEDRTGYVMPLPIPGMVAQIQSSMAATLNIDWLLDVAADLAAEFGARTERADLVSRVDGWIGQAAPACALYHPYISEAGERGPFLDPDARAGFAGIGAGSRFPDLMRAVVEGICYASRDCYEAMGGVPPEIRLTGGAARSSELRRILAAVAGVPVRVSVREEAGAAGAAMMAAVANGVYPDMENCIAEWVAPLLGAPEVPDPSLAKKYGRVWPAYRAWREAMGPVWAALAGEGGANV